MRIRTQLIIAAFVLAVVPLAAIVTYSYHSSRRALESAYRRETERLTSHMDNRLAAIRAELDERMTIVSALPLPNTTPSSADVGSLVTVMGDAAPLVDALEFHPLAEKKEKPEPPAVEQTERPEPVEVPQVAEAPEIAGSVPVPAAPPAPLIIDLPPVAFPRYVMSEEQQELIAEVGSLAGQLSNPNLDPDEREDIRAELQSTQEELRKVVAADREKYQQQMAEARDAERRRRVAIAKLRTPAPHATTAPVPHPAANSVAHEAPQTVVMHSSSMKDMEKALASAKKTSLILGRRFQASVRTKGEVVGEMTARISPDQVIRRVLGNASEDRSEIPFAIDREGTLYTRTPEDRKQLDALHVPDRVRNGRSTKGIEGWIVSTSVDEQSGLRIGVARPVGENLDELRRTAARNFALGIGLIALALIGIVPLSNHLTRDVALVTAGAERIAHGDLMTRLPVKTNNELGQLARAFNRMAEDLSVNQQKLLEQERTRKEQELQQRLMAVEYERKTIELEDARRFQLSMLPKEVPHHPAYDIAVFTKTATEVGGDYYDFHLAGDVLSVTIGDATGHGAKAGTMVTVIKTLFAGYHGGTAPAEFLRDAAEKIKRMDLGRMAMALSLGRFDSRRLTLAAAGMPPVLVHRAAANTVEEIALEATPLGTLGIEYAQVEVGLAAGDTVLFLSDGFPELMNDAAQQLGYAAALDAFASAATGATADAVIGALSEFTARWHGEQPPNDDVTFVVVRVA